MKIDKYIDKNEVECKKELEDYNSFIYVNKNAPSTPPELQNKVVDLQQTGNAKL